MFIPAGYASMSFSPLVSLSEKQNKKEDGGEMLQVVFCRNECLNQDLKMKLLTFFFEAIGEWYNPAVTRWGSVSWLSKPSLSEETEDE